MTSYQESDATSQQNGPSEVPGCLIPLIAGTLLVAVGITLASWLGVGEGVGAPDGQPSASAGRTSSEPPSPSTGSEADRLLSSLADHPAGVPSAALLEVIRSAGWTQFGQPEAIDLNNQQRVIRKFRRGDDHLQIAIQTYKTTANLQAAADQLDAPRRAVPFDHKLVVVEPITDGSAALIEPLVQRLDRFRALLDEHNGEHD